MQNDELNMDTFAQLITVTDTSLKEMLLKELKKYFGDNSKIQWVEFNEIWNVNPGVKLEDFLNALDIVDKIKLGQNFIHLTNNKNSQVEDLQEYLSLSSKAHHIARKGPHSQAYSIEYENELKQTQSVIEGMKSANLTFSTPPPCKCK